MKNRIRLAIGQINCTVGNLEGNFKKIGEYIGLAKKSGADIIAFPELSITGYPPEDLLLKPKFIADSIYCLSQLVKTIDEPIVIVGCIDKQKNDIYNAAAIIHERKIKGIYHKMFLPNYGVFDEKRYFKAGKTPSIFKYGKTLFGVNICEDIWHRDGPTKIQASNGVGIIININASPYYAGKIKDRERIIRREAKDNKVIIAYINLVGGQDELVFDGQSMIVDANGNIVKRALAFNEDLLISDLEIPEAKSRSPKHSIAISGTIKPIRDKVVIPKRDVKPLKPISEIYQALTLGLRDYVIKNGFKKAVIGLSGGIDSALVASLAVDALGKENVTGVFMPTRYSSKESAQDADALAGRLGIKFITIPIEQLFETYLIALKPVFAKTEKNITEENLQARIRGTILMALSNKFGWLVLTTGNKSEMSTGYATLYGDMAGGFAVIKDVPKILVYELAKYRNSICYVIPKRIFTKEPTAELKPGQRDRDTLPPYDKLDKILKSYVEEDMASGKIISSGFNKEMVYKVLAMVDKNEYKRWQSPPGIKITPKAFGKDRRMPITNRYREY